MKSLIIILLFLFFSPLVNANESANMRSPKNKLSPYSKLSLSKITDISCDLCACYLGIDPHYNLNTFGIRFRHRGYMNNAVQNQSENMSTDNNRNDPPSVQHEGHSHSGDTENYNTFELWGRYYINPKLQILFSIPFSRNEIESSNISGFGDAFIITQYQIFNTEVDGDTKFRNRLFMGGGLKLPTGKYNERTSSGAFEPHFQTGTGSLDFILSSTYLATFKQLGLSADISYRINTKNSNGFRFANRVNLNSSLFYKFRSNNLSLLPHMGVYYEQAGPDDTRTTIDHNSGGKILFATLGIDLYLNQLSLNFNFQKPVSEKLNGIQPENDKRIVVGLGYSFEL